MVTRNNGKKRNNGSNLLLQSTQRLIPEQEESAFAHGSEPLSSHPFALGLAILFPGEVPWLCSSCQWHRVVFFSHW